MSGLSVLKQKKSASPHGSILSLGFKKIITKNNVEEIYRSLVPLLHEQFKLGKQ